MGGGCSKSDNNQLVTNPSTNTQNTINAELSPYLSLDHPFNINHKFNLFFDILSNLLYQKFNE